jgi:ferredoxin/coenzyme F420-reducing hydrogenase delta subunit
VPRTLKLDWWYLVIYPVIERFGPGPAWYGLVGFSFLLTFLPWLPPLKRAKAAVVDLAHCNGCRRCVADCPYNAISMVPRTDGRPFLEEALVDPALCVACGICAGACPTSIAFRTTETLPTGIDLPDASIADLRRRIRQASAKTKGGPRVMVFGCTNGLEVERLGGDNVAPVVVPCIAALPPSFIDYALSRDLAEGVFVVGCAETGCANRFGVDWMSDRLGGRRDPRLRARVPRERLATCWARRVERGRAAEELAAFAARLGALAPAVQPEPPKRVPETVP